MAFVGSVGGGCMSRRRGVRTRTMLSSPTTTRSSGRGRSCGSVLRMNAGMDRRQVLQLAAAFTSVLVAGPGEGSATVNVDIDKYGDKEMKVSTINRLKQNLRNAIGQDPLLIPAFVVLPVLDALSYNANSREGGPDGSFLFEMDREQNTSLKDAIAAIKAVKDRQKEVSYADIFAFCAAVAVEVTGGPRIVIQIGREDADGKDKSGIYNNISASSSLAANKAALKRAGMNPARDAVLIHGVVQSVAGIAEKKTASKAVPIDADPYAESVFGDEGNLTYGSVGTKRKSAVLVDSQLSSLNIKGSKFDSSYLKAMLDAQKSAPDSLSTYDRELLADPECAEFVKKYASSSKSFVNDFANTLEQLTLLGSKFEQAKIRDE